MMKYFVFIRGEKSDLRDQLVRELMNGLNPDINTVRAIKISMDDYKPRDKSERKAAAGNVKKMVKKLLVASHQEQFIIIDNPNINTSDWLSILNIADDLEIEVSGIGIDIRKYEQGEISDKKYEKDPNVRMFKATMYKYTWVENEQDVASAVKSIVNIN